jgi:hypothetical protein
MKKLIILSLILGACATAPKTVTTAVDIPIAVRPNHIDIPDCPVLPINGLSKDASWDLRLKAWEASMLIEGSCASAYKNILEELNK